MPKGKKNKGKYEHRRTEQPYSSDEDAGIDMTLDNCSETSGQSDLKSIQDDAGHQKWLLYGIPSKPIFGELVENVKLYRFRDIPKRVEPLDDEDKRPQARTKRIKCGEIDDEDRLDQIERKRQLETEAQEKFEEKLLEVIDALSARSNAARAAALVSLRSALQRRYLVPLLSNQRATLADHVARALRRGRDNERRAAAAVAPLLALQIGDEGAEEFMNEVRPALAATAVDKAASLDTRSECCSSLAVLCYLLEEDLNEILEVMRMYETIFSGSYLKGDGSVKVSGAAVEEGCWHAAALDGWALLLALLAPPHAAEIMQQHNPTFPRLVEMLSACSLEVRISAGGALAVAQERVSSVGGDAGAQLDDVIPRLEQLARDSHKFRAKRDRKLQRATFRDILKYFEEDSVPSLTVRVGSETVSCESWSALAAYGALAAALGAGLLALAPHVLPLRAALGMGDLHLLPVQGVKLNKLQRHLQNTAACKARTISRNKSRDKRSAALAL